MQTIAMRSRAEATNADAKLRRRGVRGLLRQLENGQPALSFVVTARHQLGDLDIAATTIASVIPPGYQVNLTPGGGSYDTFN